MANPTSNYGWQMPTPTDLVTDLPADFEVFGQAVDTALLGLKGGTTGQVLSKTSGTDMAFTWATDASGIPATIVDAKGDIIAATAADAVSRLAVGANDTVLTADSTTATGLKWAAAAAAGGMTLLSTTNLSGTTTNITDISGSYVNLMIFVIGSDKAGAIRLNGSSVLFQGVQTYTLTTTITNTGVNNSELRINAGDGVSASNLGVAAITVYNYANTVYWKPVTQFGGFTGTSHNTALSFLGHQKTISAITSVSIVSDGGSFAAGSVLIYGVN